MQNQEYNAYGCPLRNQTGETAVKHFNTLIERLSPELRRAFEDERNRQRAELEKYTMRYGYRT